MDSLTDWQSDLEAIGASSRLRYLCSDENPVIDGSTGRNSYRRFAHETAHPAAPSALTQLVTAAAALGRAAGQALTGSPLTVSQTEYDRRLTICQNCPEFLPCGPRCRKCGCFLQVKARLESETGQCPTGQW